MEMSEIDIPTADHGTKSHLQCLQRAQNAGLGGRASPGKTRTCIVNLRCKVMRGEIGGAAWRELVYMAQVGERCNRVKGTAGVTLCNSAVDAQQKSLRHGVVQE